jgi:flavodoxin I
MKTLVVYDSVFGNTEQVARSIASAIAGTVKLTKIGSVSAQDLDGVDLLVLGSPTVGGRATKPMQDFVESIPRATAEKVRCAAFDTRLTMRFAKIFGYAAPRMADELSHKGGARASGPEGFIVKGRSGPLADGELQRASTWGRGLSAEKAES